MKTETDHTKLHTVRILPLLLIVAVGVLCYATTFFVPFILDDVTSILVNPQVRAFNLCLKPRIIGEFSFALNYRLHGLSLPGYHLVNLVFHLANACLLYAFVLTIFRTPLFSKHACRRSALHLSLACALLFVAHPLQTAAVTYLAQRVTLLAAFFYLIALILYLKARLSTQKWRSVVFMMISVLSAAAAFLSKENAVTLPLAIIFSEVIFFNISNRKRFFVCTVYVLPLAAAVLLINPGIFFQPDLSAQLMSLTFEKGAPPRFDYLLTQFPVLLEYLRLFLLPIGQNIDHDVTIRSSVSDPVVIASFLLLLAIILSALWLLINGRKSGRLEDRFLLLAGFGIGWFFIAVSLESGIIPIRDVMFEQRVYLPSAGLVMTVSALLWFFLSRWMSESNCARSFSAAVLILSATLSLLTIYRNRVWRSEVTLWEDAVGKSPAKGRAHGALGHAYQRAGRLEEAEKAYKDAVRLAPGDYIAKNNLGAIYLKQRRYIESVVEFKRSAELSPGTAAAHFNLGLAYAASGRLVEAEAAFSEAVRLKPDYSEAIKNLAALKNVMGR